MEVGGWRRTAYAETGYKQDRGKHFFDCDGRVQGAKTQASEVCKENMVVDLLVWVS